MQTLGHIKHLEVLRISKCEATDAGLACLRGLKSLRLLDVGGSPFSDEALKHLWEYLPELSIRNSHYGLPARRGERLDRYPER